MRRFLQASAFVLIAAASLPAQDAEPTDVPWDEAIEDNSFFIEEAYNQEAGVVQHISGATYTTSPDRSLVYTFTQEWPLFSHRHQLSVTLPYAWQDGVGSNGPGDILINYRYQLTDQDDGIAVAPRISFIFATGNEYDGRHGGLRGVQINIPASKRIANHFAIHLNAGMTQHAEILSSDGPPNPVFRSHKPLFFNLGASLIWLTTPRTNFLVEYSANIVDEQQSWIDWAHRTENTISPGLRQAIDIGSLQIVPGIAMPVMIAEGETHIGAFFYLSFEHPF
jgi:hypothetical protein